jgi:hypothetical protein
MRLRFTIRDLLWLAVVVALAVGWWLDHKPPTPKPIVVNLPMMSVERPPIYHYEKDAD